MRLQRANLTKKKKLEELQKELASKLHLKKEIEDWFADKVSVEFQIEREQFRVINMQSELAANQKAFDKEIETMKALL